MGGATHTEYNKAQRKQAQQKHRMTNPQQVHNMRLLYHEVIIACITLAIADHKTKKASRPKSIAHESVHRQNNSTSAGARTLEQPIGPSTKPVTSANKPNLCLLDCTFSVSGWLREHTGTNQQTDDKVQPWVCLTCCTTVPAYTVDAWFLSGW